MPSMPREVTPATRALLCELAAQPAEHRPIAWFDWVRDSRG